MLFSITQGWTGRDFDQKISHGEGLAYLLEATESRQSSDQFQETIQNTLYVPVVSPRIAQRDILIWTFSYHKCSNRLWKPYLTLGYG